MVMENLLGQLLPETEQRLDSIVQGMFTDQDIFQYYHTLAVVHWMKELLKDNSVDEYLTRDNSKKDHPLILLASAYLHDVGYVDLKKNYSYDDRLRKKEAHMINGAKLAYEITPELGLCEDQSKEISNLVLMHDKIDEIKTPRQMVLFEADSLGMLGYGMILKNGQRFESTIRGQDLEQFMNNFEARRAPKFVTSFGKKAVAEQLAQTKKYIRLHYF